VSPPEPRAGTVHVVVPEGIDDPRRPSGGNTYDRRVCGGLEALGWTVREHAVPGTWPEPEPTAASALAAVLAGIPDDAVVLLDGLVASTASDVLVPEAGRLRQVVLVHMPTGERHRGRERAVLSAASAVLATSAWTRDLLLDRHRLEPGRVHVARPGVDAADLAPGTASGGELLCVAAVTPGKGHDVLLAALGALAELPWRCVCVGTLERDPDYVARLGRQARQSGVGDRVEFVGPRTGPALEASYAAADVLVLASRAETYGMVVTEALARGLPSVATSVGGLPEALDGAPGGERPGLLVPPDDPQALAGALSSWLGDAVLRRDLRSAARERRASLPGWPRTAREVARVLAGAAP
jgi:glycosyltransferase involved in cell wall biosynthesis